MRASVYGTDATSTCATLCPANDFRRPSLPGLAFPLALKTKKPADLDPDLARVVDAWLTLPEAIRRSILAILKTAVG